MLPLYVGIDVAGGRNTWIACLVAEGKQLYLEQSPRQISLSDIVALAEQRDIVAVAIDAQLSLAVSDENGFRSSDIELRQLLPAKFRTWVASFNSLMAVPIRARILTEALSPSVATLIETHPRASLYFAMPLGFDVALSNYKKGVDAPNYVNELWQAWSSKFNIQGDLGSFTDGALDAVVCATVAYLAHKQPEVLLRLRHTAKDKAGRGPFFVVSPS